MGQAVQQVPASCRPPAASASKERKILNNKVLYRLFEQPSPHSSSDHLILSAFLPLPTLRMAAYPALPRLSPTKKSQAGLGSLFPVFVNSTSQGKSPAAFIPMQVYLSTQDTARNAFLI
ncbi:hypothetical protein M407DRAFT_17479 [Tulasnella calospora MUT 4182]|uniref:Uncharacterized protein n=1 Tax=Tulasnella calospora MUT 4182 TaxID=1051891 RepID=A0A0C3MJL1_9AGAM|nr:hypothetical protein M407DRAFT_17479 [Tulasnella calospora MUT 4182]